MKKVFFFAMALTLAFAAMAQNTSLTEQQQREWRQLKHQRDFSQQHLKSNIPLSQTPISATKSNTKALPQDRVWFPGEWEEVQAVVVTLGYSYEPLESQGRGTYIADPIVTGVAEYYQYSGGNYQSTGTYGPYKSSIDTTSTFGKTFFYLMDGIQLGGAQAWVRIEQASDSLIVLRTLRRMNLRSDNVRFIIGSGNSFWYRDCGPICFYYGDQDSVAMLDFEYYPGRALDDSLPSHIHRQMGLPNYITTLEWEGGNCLVDGAGFLFTSDAIYSSNRDYYGQLTWNGRDLNTINYQNKPSLTNAQTRQAFHDLLGQRETHVLPAYQYDGGTGHIDLYADMWDENGFVFSIMPSNYSNWTDYRTGSRNIDSLCSYTSIFDRAYKHDSIPFPCTDNGGNFASQSAYNRNYTRTYSNHTFVNNVILQPVFSTVSNGRPTAAWEQERYDQIQAAYPGYTLYPIDVRDFDGSGGAIHCITKQIPAENPVRILHKTITGSANGMRGHDIPVSAVITNKTGISHAECIYRINGGEWNNVTLNGNGNKFSALLPTAGINERVLDTLIVPVENDSIDSSAPLYDTIINVHDTLVTIEYYISATSNNGKTITKPMTASQGGYYSFYFNGNEAELDSTEYDFSTDPRPLTDITFVFDANRTYYDNNEEPGEYDWNDDTEGIAETEGQQFGQFFPNPATDKANIKIDLGNGSNYQVSIIDNLGRTVHTTALNAAGSITFTIEAGKLAKGIYNVVFTNHDNRIVRRLVVE